MTVQDLLKKIKEEKYSVIAIRHLCDDEKYNIGDICRNSYDYDVEYDVSTYYRDQRELNGTCGYNIPNIDYLNEEEVEEAKEMIVKALKESEDYGGTPIIIAGHHYEYGNDEEEVIIKYAEVIATSIEGIM